MKSIIAICIVVAAMTANDFFYQAGKNVENTPHNLLKATQGSMNDLGIRDLGDACAYCHIPHGANSNLQSWLSNRILPAITDYNDEESQIINLDSTSLACLSCHDGTLPLDAVRNLPAGIAESSSDITIHTCSQTCHTPSNPAGNLIFREGNFGSGLRNHHPVGIQYDISKNQNLYPASHGKVGDLPLYGENDTQIGCATCHDPHDNSYRPFLRTANADGELCSACHKN